MGRFVWYLLVFIFFCIASSSSIVVAFAFTGICAVLAIFCFVAYHYGFHSERIKSQRKEEDAPRESFVENWGRRLAEWANADKGSSQ